MKLPKDNQVVMVNCKDGKLEYGRFYEKSALDSLPIFEVHNKGGNLRYRPDEVKSWRPLTKQELRQYGFENEA